ncbi:MAG TPA: tetratricopeptide repeat protein [Pirellulales bacterium]
MSTATQTSTLATDFDPLVLTELGSLAALAEREHAAKRFASAAAVYRKIVALRPDAAEAFNNLGNVFKDQGKLDEAAARYRHAIALKPELFQAHNNLGNVLLAQGKLDEAMARYEQALAIRPDLATVHVNLGGVLNRQGRLHEAAGQYECAVALDPGLFQAYNILGNIYRQLGKPDQAVAQYRQAIALRPDLAIAFHNLGTALVDQNKLRVAAAQFERAVTLNPRLFQAHVALGCIFEQLGTLDRAETSFKQAIALRPNIAEGHHTLGKVLREQGKLDEARAALERAISLDPDLSQVHNTLGCVLQEQEQFEQALECYTRALALEPQSAEAHHNRGNALQQLGRLDEAVAHFHQALALRPDYPEAHHSRSELKTFRDGDADLAAMQELAADTGRLPGDKKVFMHFAIGKALEDVGDYPAAFGHFLQGNALRRREVQYCATAAQEVFNRITERFDAAFFDRFRDVGDPSQAPIFVVGMPRSGSTLVEQILASHPQVHACGEMDNLERLVQRICDADGRPILFPDSVGTLDAGGLRQMGQAYLASLPALADGKIRITNKMLGNFLRVGLIRLILPHARIIHTVRDPVDTCVSCFSKRFVLGHGFSYDLAELGAFYRCYHQLMDHWRSVLPAGVMLDVAYENVVDNLEEQARRLIDYCGLPWDDRCLNFHKNDRPITTASNVQVRQPLYRSSLGRWRRYEAFLGPLLAELESCRQPE